MAADAASNDRRTTVRATADAGPAKRTRTVAVRLTDAEEAAWIAAAAADGHRQIGAWVRERAVAGYLGKVRPKAGGGGLSAEAAAEVAAMRQQMTKVGNNLNQIARAINSGQVPPQMAESLEKGWLERWGQELGRMADRLDALEG
ncbi:MobC family plasmid mobilization relaxosome protein (plasmid) [Rhodococcus aetherivorans]|uniref:MobC family plasmid mobilization relaxosome protein n=1 Tax=Rhodococcus aetherivorans TaxID=191292 RepID=UPI0026EF9538|nr:MobC family plasmid mobilization relaxosome protein [Rhodococcus aetherivorans]WKX02140.1 MobC family plasmid mobilization relaxosome protein [Rhodococcus aetherivorans]